MQAACKLMVGIGAFGGWSIHRSHHYPRGSACEIVWPPATNLTLQYYPRSEFNHHSNGTFAYECRSFKSESVKQILRVQVRFEPASVTAEGPYSIFVCCATSVQAVPRRLMQAICKGDPRTLLAVRLSRASRYFLMCKQSVLIQKTLQTP